MQENVNERNQATVVGTVIGNYKFSHELYNEKFYEFMINVSRLSDVTDILPIMISERLIKIEELVEGTIVEVKGQLRSYNNQQNHEDNKLKLTIFARSVEFVSEQDEDKFLNPNQIFLDGFICKQPAYRKTPLGREICDIIIAVNRAYNKSDYIPVIAWGRNAKFCEGLNVGDNVQIFGRVQSRTYDKKLPDETLITKIAYEVSASKLKLTENNNRKIKE